MTETVPLLLSSLDPFQLVNIRITKDELDFLENDGGISAILKTVSVKFDADNLRALIENKNIIKRTTTTGKKFTDR